MRCERVRPLLSAAMENGDLSGSAAAHVETCRSCQAFRSDLGTLRGSLRIEPVGPFPDVAPRVLARLPRRPPRQWLAPAAGFGVGAVIGASLVGGFSGPDPILAAPLPEAVVAVQDQVRVFAGRFSATERIRPGVARNYTGELEYQAPESVSLQISQVDGPHGWLDNSTLLVIDEDGAFSSQPFPCPTLDGCADRSRREVEVEGRDPFSSATLAPLDLVVPASVFRDTREPQRLGNSIVAGRETVGVSVSAAQARPLLTGIFGAGNWREIHDTDVVLLWLDADLYTPLALEVHPGESTDRATWAARRGYIDQPGTAYIELRYEFVDYDPLSIEIEIMEGAEVIVAGYRVTELGTVPLEVSLPLIAEGRISGDVEVEVWAWSDGRAWLRLDRTSRWSGPGLFGNLGEVVRRVELGNGPAYLAGDGSAVFLHSQSEDIAIYGSIDSEQLIAYASRVEVESLPVPDDWWEGSVATELPSGVLLPAAHEDEFFTPVVRNSNGVVIVDLATTDKRSLRITSRPASFLRPPIDPDTRLVTVRGVVGRYAPQLGLLEWMENGAALGLSSRSFTLEELLGVANDLESP